MEGPIGVLAGENVALTLSSDDRQHDPDETHTIFKNRWMAVLWAAGIIWFALQVGAPDDKPVKTAGNDDTGLTDVTGHKITSKDEEVLKNAFNRVKKL